MLLVSDIYVSRLLILDSFKVLSDGPGNVDTNSGQRRGHSHCHKYREATGS